MNNWYVFVGGGPRSVFRSEQEAWEAFSRYNDRCNATQGRSAQTLHGGNIRLYECSTRDLARTADISEVRRGERVVAIA